MLLLNKKVTLLQECIDLCVKCAQSCNKCFKTCLAMDDINEMKEALAILVDCAELCYVTAAYLCGDKLFSGDICKSCAEVCEKCADICEAFEDLHCKASVEICRQCAELCKSIK